MKIAVLNDSFFSDSHMKELRELGEVVVFENTANTETAIERTGDADIVVGDPYLSEYNKHYFESTSNLKLLALNTTGYTMTDTASAKERGIQIANVPGFSKRAVAEMAIGLMFDSVRRISYGDRRFRELPFEPDPATPEAKEFIGYELSGKTLGVVGYGNIGSEIASIGKGIGMNVIAWNRQKREGVELVSLETLFSTSDVVMISVVSSEETKKLVSRELLSLMKPRSVLVSIARSEVIDGEALYETLHTGKIWGVALDMSGATEGGKFLTLHNAILTPHIGSYTEEAFYKNMPSKIVGNIRSFVSGKPENIVNL